MSFLLEMVNFYCHVSLLEGTFFEHLLGHLDCGGLLFLTEGNKTGWREPLRAALGTLGKVQQGDEKGGRWQERDVNLSHVLNFVAAV